ncbi:MAG TPA: PIN domain-containing protein [Bacteroidales bacterium]|nr:PIN domain-containing protein [Bacteroidales bacterium]HPF03816.1 PIN domain-containing protein [Bacteroidales bacterium]HPJ59631.1 PIN domain-containing protein [Bacteroidales bacterium]HPR10944.1 PIN domain-containing protein [Bacteroidales bacterium]HRW85815.1 PIN domain-containing protein [Bacteroidales bacterium]
MKIFLDANVLIAVLNREYPLFSLAARILSLQDGKRFSIYTSPICLAIAFYFAEKKSGTASARKKISLLASHISIAPTGTNEVNQTIAARQISDFEDGLEYYSAVNAGCNIIITEDTGDFHFSEIEILNCGQFLRKYFK